MIENEEEGRVKVKRPPLIKFQLVFETILRVIKRMDFVEPEGFFVKGVKSQSKTNDKAKD
jgi:hypothetical protein